MQRVESCHLFFFLASQCICQKRECVKRSAKSALSQPPVLEKNVCIYFIYMRVHVCVCGILCWNQFFLMFVSHSYVGESERRGILNHVQFHATILV